jgi:cephalosporin-C deacetylase
MATNEDIRAFWDRTRAALDGVGLEAVVEPVESDDPLIREGANKSRAVFSVILSSFEGKRIRAWYTVPRGEPPRGGWPAILEVPGYSGALPPSFHLSQYGYALLSLFPRSQGESLKEWAIDSGTRLVHGIEDKERYYYRGAYMDCVRGVDFLCSRAEVNAARIGMYGLSQGAGLTLATASLDRRIRAAVAAVPWLCNFRVAAGIAAGPYAELRDYLEEHPDLRGQAMQTLAYFDPLNLCAAIGCPTLVAAAAVDEVHPLRAALPVFDAIPGLKSLLVYPDLQHEFHSDFPNHAKAWFDRYLR